MGSLGSHLLTLLLVSDAAGTGGEAKVLADESWDQSIRFAQAQVLDRLITQGRSAQPEVLARLFPKFRDQTTILLVRHPLKPYTAWMDLLPRTNVADSHWLAFANALLRARSPRFARYLLEELPHKIEVRAIDPDGIGGGSFGGVTGCPLRSEGPRLACYRLEEQPTTGESGWQLFSEGPHRVFFRREEIDGVSANCGHCSTDPSGDSARHYLRDYVSRLCALPETALDPLFSNNLSAEPDESLDRLEARALARHTQALELAVGHLRKAGLLTGDAPNPATQITVIDRRTHGR